MIDISKLIEIVKDPDLKLKINELYGENISLKEENFKLRKKEEEDNKIEKIKKNLTFEENHYYLKENDNKIGPYCTKCWDSDNKLIHLHDGGIDNGLHFF